MTYEEAIEILQEERDWAQQLSYVNKALDMAREALEKQIPKRAETRYGITYYCPPDCGGSEFDEYGDILICPSCKADIEESNMYCKHCKECGQAIDWSRNK